MKESILKLTIAQPTITKNVRQISIPVSSEDVNLVDAIRSIVGKERKVSMGRYYSNCNLMNFEDTYPYIVRDGVIEWFAPFNEVSIKEFRNTHTLKPEDTIRVEVDNYGGAGDEVSEIVSWILCNWETLSAGGSLLSAPITIGGFVQKVYKYLSNKKNRIPNYSDFKESVEQESKWNISDLMKRYNISDSGFMDVVMKTEGYKLDSDNYIKASQSDDKKEGRDDIAERLWGKTCCNRISGEITSSIHLSNLLLTDLKYRSENVSLDCFTKVDKIVSELLAQWSEYITKGEAFCFIQLVNPPGRSEANTIVKELDGLRHLIYNLLDRIGELEQEEKRDYRADIDNIRYDINEQSDEDGYDGYDEEDEGYDPSLGMIATKLFLSDQLVKIRTGSGSVIAYIKQVYDDDILIQEFSDKGEFLGYKNINYYDILLISMKTKQLLSLEEIIQKHHLPSLVAYGSSAKEFIVDYAREHDMMVTILAQSISKTPLFAKIGKEDIHDSFDTDQVIKLELLNQEMIEDGCAWIELVSIDSIIVN